MMWGSGKMKLKNVVYFARSETSHFHLEICRKLVQEAGCTVYFFCNGADQLSFYKTHSHAGLFSDIVDANILLSEVVKRCPSTDSLFDDATEIENWLDMPFSRLSVANRHLGRGFSPGGGGHPQSLISKTVTEESCARLLPCSAIFSPIF